jgi:hypothetical protein
MCVFIWNIGHVDRPWKTKENGVDDPIGNYECLLRRVALALASLTTTRKRFVNDVPV